MDFICPKSPKVWDGNGFSACFADMVLGFGSNMVTITAVSVLAFKYRRAGRSLDMRISLLEKVFLHMIPILEACLSFYEMCILLKNNLQGFNSDSHDWFLRCSQFVSWMTIVLLLKFRLWSLVLCNPILCFWWILKPLLEIPHLLTVFSSVQAMTRFKEIFSVFAEIMFCLIVNIIRVTRPFTLKSEADSLEDPLISRDMRVDDDAMNLDCRIGCFWDLVTFKFVNSMMDLGVTKQLNFGDLVQLPCDLSPSSCHNTILRCWVTELNDHSSHPLLLRAIFSAYGWPYMRLGLLKVFNDGIGFVGPLLLNKLIRFLQQGSGHVDGYMLALSLGLTSTLKSFLDTQYSFHLLKLKLKLRASIMTIVYHKCLHINLAERSKFSVGEIQTFMSIDTDRTVNLCNSFHDMWSLPLQIFVALYLLYTQVSFAFVSGVAIIIMLIPVNKWISTMIATATEKMMKQKDERIRSAGEILTYIRTLKMYSWENLFSERLMKIRELEVKYLSIRKYLDAWCVFFWATTPTLFSLFTFGAFTLMGHQLNAATAFTCVALFNTLISPLNSFPWVINGLIDAIISARRLSKFLSCPEHTSSTERPSDEQLYKTDIPPCQSNNQNATNANAMAVVFQNASSVWSSSCEGKQSTVLSGITLEFPKGLFIAIVGEIGSGKSSLLNSILGEMLLSRGLIHSHGSISFVPQVPWIMSGSVRENILFGEEINAGRYQEVLRACALDIDISLMAGGDLACIKEKGFNLSGGQRARLALARAVYRDSDIYLLDDVLSSVDSQVAYWILQKTILGSLMDKKTRVLCTHNPQAISAADMIVVMDKGNVKWSGTLSHFLQSPYAAVFSPGEQMLASHLQENESSSCSSSVINCTLGLEINCASVSEVEGSTEMEFRKEGRVEFSVYKGYARFSSWKIVILICISAFFMQASRNGNDLWLSHWVDSATSTGDTTYYLVIFSIFSATNSFLTLVRAFSFSYGGLRAAVQVHAELLKKLVKAPIQFFDQNPSGRILNRFSSDLYTIDDSLPFILNILLANFLNLLGIAIILSYSQIFFLLLLFPFWHIFRKLQVYYRSTSRELRRLDSIARSPIYTSFTESLDGSSTIRALGKEVLFMTRFVEHVASYQQTSYSELTASLWLSLRLQLIAAFVISFIAAMAVMGCRGEFPLMLGTPGLVGLALSNAAPMVSLLSSFLTSFTETEKEMVSVERVLQYMDIPQEDIDGPNYMAPDWPLHGYIEFEHVTLKYRPSLPAALNNVSFKIATGMQVGIVGRTGAGKSSVINALFRLTPICSGHILVDGVDVAGLSVGDLRRHLAVVPQSPFLFEGSLRENLDPYGNTSDSKIWEALEKCNLKADIESSGGLDIHVKEGGISFSVGQRQLICLARALIKSSKILCLDECTANVDTQTASVLQNTISVGCQGMTVLTIAHRISVVMNMDTVLILDQGVLVEQGNPQILVKDSRSRFSSFARSSTL